MVSQCTNHICLQYFVVSLMHCSWIFRHSIEHAITVKSQVCPKLWNQTARKSVSRSSVDELIQLDAREVHVLSTIEVTQLQLKMTQRKQFNSPRWSARTKH